MCVFDTYVQLFVVSVFVGFSAIEELETTRWVKYVLYKQAWRSEFYPPDPYNKKPAPFWCVLRLPALGVDRGKALELVGHSFV